MACWTVVSTGITTWPSAADEFTISSAEATSNSALRPLLAVASGKVPFSRRGWERDRLLSTAPRCGGSSQLRRNMWLKTISDVLISPADGRRDHTLNIDHCFYCLKNTSCAPMHSKSWAKVVYLRSMPSSKCPI